MNTQIIHPKIGETYIVENHDGELTVRIISVVAIKNLTLQLPETPYRASKIFIHSSQEIKNLTIVGQLMQPITSMKPGNIDLVFCPTEQKYVEVARNETQPTNNPVVQPQILEISEVKKDNTWKIMTLVAIAAIALVAGFAAYHLLGGP